MNKATKTPLIIAFTMAASTLLVGCAGIESNYSRWKTATVIAKHNKKHGVRNTEKKTVLAGTVATRTSTGNDAPRPETPKRLEIPKPEVYTGEIFTPEPNEISIAAATPISAEIVTPELAQTAPQVITGARITNPTDQALAPTTEGTADIGVTIGGKTVDYITAKQAACAAETITKIADNFAQETGRDVEKRIGLNDNRAVFVADVVENGQAVPFLQVSFTEGNSQTTTQFDAKKSYGTQAGVAKQYLDCMNN